MTASDDQSPRGRPLAVALAADPALAEELEVIVASFDAGARERFLAALADELPHQARPAAAVLAALERAAQG